LSYVKTCKVCNSKHKGIIEELATKGFSAEKIHAYLASLTNPQDMQITLEENIPPQAIRRHLQRHFDEREDFLVNEAQVKNKIKRNREDYNKGLKINIDKANTLSHMIELALTRLEEIESLSESKKHQYTIGYMGQIKSLIDELNKVSGSLDNTLYFLFLISIGLLSNFILLFFFFIFGILVNAFILLVTVFLSSLFSFDIFEFIDIDLNFLYLGNIVVFFFFVDIFFGFILF
jgi:hypothetical protein